MVQLLSNVFLHGIDVDHVVLPTDLFPGCEGCDADFERSLSPSCDPKPDVICGCIWLPGYV